MRAGATAAEQEAVAVKASWPGPVEQGRSTVTALQASWRGPAEEQSDGTSWIPIGQFCKVRYFMLKSMIHVQ